MYKVNLFQYKSQCNAVFNVNPGNEDFSIIFVAPKGKYRFLLYSVFPMDFSHLLLFLAILYN
jgi:hypothetical protein